MTTAVAPAPPQKTSLSTVKGWLESDAFKDQIARALPAHMKPDRFMRIAITATMKTPKLLQCTQESLFGCLLSLSQYGLEPDGRRAHLIPYENKRAGTVECTLIIDYKGLAELVMRSGLVSSIHADVVCDNDAFEYDKGFILTHRIDFKQPRGEAYAAYAVIKFKDGSEKTEVMTKDEIHAIRNRGQGWQAFQKGWAKQSPWDPREPVIEREMWKKTAFRRVSKWVPLSAEIRDAVEHEDEADEVIRDIGPAEPVVTNGKSKADQLADMLASRLEAQEAAETEKNSDEAPSPPSETQPAESATDSPGDQTPPAELSADELADWQTKIAACPTLTNVRALEDQAAAIPMPQRQAILDMLKTRTEEIRAARGTAAEKGKLI